MGREFLICLFLFYILLSSSSASANTITGTVTTGGEESEVSFETNILTAQSVTIDDIEFEITIIGDTFILAGSESLEIGIVFGAALTSVLQCSKDTIVKQYHLENIDELDCSKESKGFFYLKTSEFTIGNCIN